MKTLKINTQAELVEWLKKNQNVKVAGLFTGQKNITDLDSSNYSIKTLKKGGCVTNYNLIKFKIEYQNSRKKYNKMLYILEYETIKKDYYKFIKIM